VYDVIAEPFDAGAVHETVIFSVPATTTTLVGASGAFAGVIELEASDALDAPFALLAFTVKVYAVPFDKPETVQEVVGAFTVQVKSPGLDVTV
jgi:hypothetical protein